jgi:polyisoprenoid-binding protein YceI
MCHPSVPQRREPLDAFDEGDRVTVLPGHYGLGPDNGSVQLRTARHGLAARVGHDLLLGIGRWQGALVVGEDDVQLDLELDLRSLEVLGVRVGRPLGDGDRGAILGNAARLLQVEAHPTARFTASGPTSLAGGGRLDGSLAVRGSHRPVRLLVVQVGRKAWRATTTVRQSSYGIEPYSAMLGALRLADAVEVEAALTLNGG